MLYSAHYLDKTQGEIICLRMKSVISLKEFSERQI